MENRKVVVYEYQRKSGSGYIEPSKIEIGKGKLLSFGIDYEELTCAVGTFSTAIVEMEDGSVKNVPVENIKFEPELPPRYNGRFENLKDIADEMASSFKAAYSEDMTPKEQLPEERRKWINEELEKYTDKHCCGNYVQIRDNGSYEMQGMFEEKHLKEIMGILKMATE